MQFTDYAQQGDGIFVYASFTNPKSVFFRTKGGRMRHIDLWAGLTLDEEHAKDIAWAHDQRSGGPRGVLR